MQLKNDGKVIGFTASTFDLLHSGHVVMLEEAKSKCDYLVVGLLTDPTIDRADTKNKPIQSMFERFIQVSSIECVDFVIPFESENDLVDVLLTIRPNIRVVGEEYRDIDHTGKNIEGIQIIYNERKHSFSTSELRTRVMNEEYKKENS